MNNHPPTWRVWLLAARPKTLPAAVVPVLVGSAFAAHDGLFQGWPALLCLGFALLVQIGTNYANDYGDFVRGADTPQRTGPVRAVAAGWVTPAAMRRAAALVFALALAAGFDLVRFGGWGMLPLGLLCIGCGAAYTGGPYPLSYNGLGDLFVFLFFGLVAVGATYWVQARALTPDVLLAAVAVGLLAANLLVANNWRDREGDARAGKRTLVVRFGERAGRWQYLLAVLFSFAVPFVLAGRGYGRWGLLPLVALPLGRHCLVALQPGAPPDAVVRLLARSAAYLALYGVLLAAAVWPWP